MEPRMKQSTSNPIQTTLYLGITKLGLEKAIEQGGSLIVTDDPSVAKKNALRLSEWDGSAPGLLGYRDLEFVALGPCWDEVMRFRMDSRHAGHYVEHHYID